MKSNKTEKLKFFKELFSRYFEEKDNYCSFFNEYTLNEEWIKNGIYYDLKDIKDKSSNLYEYLILFSKFFNKNFINENEIKLKDIKLEKLSERYRFLITSKCLFFEESKSVYIYNRETKKLDKIKNEFQPLGKFYIQDNFTENEHEPEEYLFFQKYCSRSTNIKSNLFIYNITGNKFILKDDILSFKGLNININNINSEKLNFYSNHYIPKLNNKLYFSSHNTHMLSSQTIVYEDKDLTVEPYLKNFDKLRRNWLFKHFGKINNLYFHIGEDKDLNPTCLFFLTQKAKKFRPCLDVNKVYFQQVNLSVWESLLKRLKDVAILSLNDKYKDLTNLTLNSIFENPEKDLVHFIILLKHLSKNRKIPFPEEKIEAFYKFYKNLYGDDTIIHNTEILIKI